MTPDELAAGIGSRYSDVLVAREEVTVVVDRDGLIDALAFLRDDPALALGSLSSITAVDRPGREPRFWVVYELRSHEHHHRARVKIGVPEDDPRVQSVTPSYPTANWHERETYDFYGIVFDGHPDLSRILLPDDWEGFPLRKTEELGGVNTRFHGSFIPPVDQRTSS